VKRRQAINLLGGAAGGVLLIPGEFARVVAFAREVRASAQPPSRAAAATLTPARARVMASLAEVIVPETDTPGAGEAGVVEFVAALVDGWLDDDERDRFLAGLDTVDPACRERFGANFFECAPGEQAAIVRGLDDEVQRLREDSAADETRHFFHDVKRFTLTAYFTSEVGLAALGHRTTFRAFEGCAPVSGEEGGVR